MAYDKSKNSTNQNLVLKNDLFCQYCGKQCRNLNSLKQHTIRCNKNPDKIKSVVKNNLKNQGWAKGLTANTDDRIHRSKEMMHKYYETHAGSMTGKHHSQKTRELLSQLALTNGIEGHFGRHKSYEYLGVKFMSSYEVAVAESLDANGVRWVKPSRLAYVDLDGKKHHYTADFYLPTYAIYLDPKNDYLINNPNPKLKYLDSDKIKWVMEQNNVKIYILDKNSLSWSEIQKKIDGGME